MPATIFFSAPGGLSLIIGVPFDAVLEALAVSVNVIYAMGQKAIENRLQALDCGGKRLATTPLSDG